MLIVKNSGGSAKFPTQIYIAVAPTKKIYQAGDTVNTTGMVVKAKWSNKSETDITSECTVSPSQGTIVFEQTENLTITWTWKDTITLTTSQKITVKRVLTGITIDSMPAKTSYYKGDTLNFTGLKIKATYSSGATDIVDGYTCSPAAGSALTNYGNISVTVTYTENDVTKNATFNVTVNVKIVSYNAGTDEEIQAMIDAHYQDAIDISDYWSVGDTRTIHLSAMSATGVGESHAAQDIRAAIIGIDHDDLVTPINGHTKACVTEQVVEFLGNGSTTEYGYLNSTITSSDTSKYSTDLARFGWLSDVFEEALPTTVKNGLKSIKKRQGTSHTGTESEEINVKSFLLSYPEVFGTATYSYYTAKSPAEGTQYDYYKTSANRIKYGNNNGQSNGTAYYWWLSSQSSYYSSSRGYYWMLVSSDGSANNGGANGARGLAPAFSR